MSGWTEFILAFAAFLAAHVIPMRPALKSPLIAVLGRAGYIAAFSLLSLGLLYWLLMAAGRAPFVEVWPQAGWQRWLVNLAMPVAVLAAATAGMAGLMAAFTLWAGAHLLANGDLAHVLLFGPLLIFAASGIWGAEARARRALPDFERLAARTSIWPGAALISGRWRPRGLPSFPRLLIAGVVWAALLHLHAPLIGLSPLP